NADFSSSTVYSNLTGVGTLTSGALGAGFSAVNVAQGGTGQTSFTANSLIAGNGTSGLQAIGTGTAGQVLVSSGPGGLPQWVSGSGSICSDCVLTDPGASSVDTIAPSLNGVTGLTVRQTSGGGTADIFDVTDSAGTTNYISVDHSGNIILGGLNAAGVVHTNASGQLSTGLLTNADFSSSTVYSNITGVGTLTSGALGAGFSAVNVAQGGTGQTSFTANSLIAGNGTSGLQAIGTGTAGQVLVSSGPGGLPQWVSGSGSICSDCVLTDPGASSVDTIAPSLNGVTGLTVRQTSGGGTADIFDVTDSAGTTNYISVDHSGNIILGGLNAAGVVHTNASGQLSTGLLTNADFSSSTVYSNITGVGTLTSGALGAGFSAVNVAQGGTGQTSFTANSLIAGNGTSGLQAIGTGTAGQVLVSSGPGGLPQWVSGSGSICSDCVLTDPGASSVDTIAPSLNGVTGLTVRQTSGGGTADIFDVTDSAGTTNYISVDHSG